MKTGRKGRFAMRRKQHVVIVSGWDEELKSDPEASVLEPSSGNSFVVVVVAVSHCQRGLWGENFIAPLLSR